MRRHEFPFVQLPFFTLSFYPFFIVYTTTNPFLLYIPSFYIIIIIIIYLFNFVDIQVMYRPIHLCLPFAFGWWSLFHFICALSSFYIWACSYLVLLLYLSVGFLYFFYLRVFVDCIIMFVGGVFFLNKFTLYNIFYLQSLKSGAFK